MNKERRLGRGLEALLGRLPEAPAPDSGLAVVAADEGANALMQVNVFDVDRNPFQPRREFDDADLAELCESIQQHGLLQPVAVRRVGERYQLVAGERRLRAAIKAGWNEVPAILVEADDREVAELAIVENLQRKDLNPLEKAASFQAYIARYQCTQDELAGRLHVDRSTIANLIRLLELPDEVQQSLRRGAISQGHARALLPLGDERTQTAYCRRIEEEGLSVRAVESLVSDALVAVETSPVAANGTPAKKAAGRRSRTGHIASLEQELRAALGAKVEIRPGAKGSGRFVLHFANHEEFERLFNLLADAASGPALRQAG